MVRRHAGIHRIVSERALIRSESARRLINIPQADLGTASRFLLRSRVVFVSP